MARAALAGLCGAWLAGAAGAAFAATAPRAITHEDLWTMPRIGAPRVSPDGRWAVFQVAEPAYEERRQRSDLWLVPVDGSAPPRRLTSTSGREAGVDWSPDGTQLAFSARREGDEAEQIYLLPLQAGGEAFRITRAATGASSPVFAPDGRSIAYTSLVHPGAADDAANRRAIEERRARKWNARVYEGFPIRNWDRWLDERRPSLWVVDLPPPGQPPGPARNLLAGSKLIAQPGFAGRSSDLSPDLDAVWTPDGAGLVFVASDDRHRAAHAFTSQQLWLVPRAGGEPRRLTAGADGWARPSFTPDGRRLVAQVERRSDRVYSKTQLAVIDWPSAAVAAAPGAAALEPRWISAALDRSVGSHAPSADSRSVYFTAEEHGHEKLFVVPLSGRLPPRLVFEPASGVYTNLAIAPRARTPVLVANWEDANSPPEVVRIDPVRGAHAALSEFGTARAAALDLPELRHFWFTSSKGRRIHSMLVLPPGFDPAKRYPLFNMIHGGPHIMWRDQWFLRWNYHLIAAPGYVVLLTNYSGSTGFGEEFARTIQGDPLRTAGEELNEAVDAALREFPFIDPQRHCAGGASYGGHLANWLQATTTRYRCLVSHAGLVNLEAQWGTSDTVYAREVNGGGPVWEQGPVWREQNPIRYAGSFRTPALVTIGEQDFRVPLNNALEYWTVLQRLQIPSRLVVFPEENHWILGGENSRLFYREIHDWLGRWIGPVEPAPGRP